MNVCFIGGGNMASALIGGLIKGGTPPAQLRALEIDATQRARLAAQFGIGVFDSAAPALAGTDCLVLAVKPQQVRALAQSIAPLLAGQLVLTICAGIRTVDLARWLGGHARIARAMPNTPALIGQGVSGLYADAALGADDRRAVERILAAVGSALWVDREPLIDAVTAVSGSGPAYVFLLIEAFEAAACASGLSAEQARALVLGTFGGASALAAQSPEPPQTLRARVTSRGGTTERGIAALEAGGVRETVARAVAAAHQRAIELGTEFGAD
jgi:pyrroline-5-carboxylate reductase